jgi:hypothetical protein
MLKVRVMPIHATRKTLFRVGRCEGFAAIRARRLRPVVRHPTVGLGGGYCSLVSESLDRFKRLPLTKKGE